MKPLKGKVAIVTGASAPRGIGRAIALRLAQDGASVVVTDMHAATNQRLAEQNNMSVSEIMDLRYKDVSLRRAGESKDVADAVAYLVGPEGAYITGIALPVAGGVPFRI